MDNKLYKSSFGPGVHDDDSFKSQRMPIGSWGTDVPDHTAPVESEPTTTSDQECKTKKEKLNKEITQFKKTLGWTTSKTTKAPLKDAIHNGVNRIKCLFAMSKLPADKLPKECRGECLWYLFATAGIDIAVLIALATVGVSFLSNIAEIITLFIVERPFVIEDAISVFYECIEIFAKGLVAWGVLVVARVVGAELDKEQNDDVVKIVAGTLLAVFLLICF